VETLDLKLSEFTRRAGSLLVAHSDTTMTRGLEPGESVVVRDGLGGGFLMATVRDISFDLTDTHYRLELGAAVSAAEADLLAAETARTPAAHEEIDLGGVLALLHQARELAAERSYLAEALHR
jgi:hypothetical protein